ncbi:hypothetical protein FE374_10955 [Georgenia yuyongxinii]|uniref:Polymerase/histidinol phosphatase N-terminal domain-containing protein n=1 Tax=Georgenia yuyongxinii TaxID=2589797 RepID=A0A5B8CAE6_9MICO|nr:hypothetical protein [Georgenia yuyongxinii]QDC25056.1 hypothetical protein FE374_10955 [Georgenia yuyongxinii]
MLMSAALAVVLGAAAATPALANETDYTIDNPYADVKWSDWAQYTSALHNHSYESDGGNTPAERFEDAYAKGFDIFALTDHNFTNTAWDRTDRPESNDRGKLEYLSTDRLEEMRAGVGRDAKGMLPISYANEQSRANHLLTFWADFNNQSGATLEGNIAQAEELGGVSVVAHPGRYTGGARQTGAQGLIASSHPETVQKYVDLFTRYDSAVGMEIINKKDGDSASDRILWDNILTQTMPERPVWAQSNDDAHSNGALGFSYNVHLMPELSEGAFRHSLEAGTYYASAKVSYRELGNEFISQGATPTISDITVDGDADTVTITGVDTESVRWISEGEVIAEGATIDLDDHDGKVGSYVRAELVGPGGISFTQPFGVHGGPGREVVEVGGIELTASSTTVTADQPVQVTTTATDAQGAPVDLSGAVVAYDTVPGDIISVADDGTITVVNPPLANMAVKVRVTVIAAGQVHTDDVTLTVDVGSTDNLVVAPVLTGDDDVEEYVSSGRMYLDSSDLEIVREGTTEQAVGLRFADLPIPAGAQISEAYVQFTVDEPEASTEDFAVDIRVEDVDDATPFTTETANLTSRAFSEQAVSWADVPLWTVDREAGPDQRTPDLSALLQQIVDRDSWATGNAMVFKITGEGNRSADAFESNAGPVLHVVWTMPEEVPAEEDPEGEREAVIDFRVKTNQGRFVDITEAKAAALREVNYSTGRVVEAVRDFQGREKSFVITVETATKQYRVAVDAETGDAQVTDVTEL